MILQRLIFVVGVTVAVLMAASLPAQDPSQHDFRRGDSQNGGRGGNRGGRGGGFGDGGFDTIQRLRRFDTNGNGLIEPSEITDRARPFIERLAQQAGLDINAPMPIDRLAAAADQNWRDRPAQADQSRPNDAATNANPAKPATENKDSKSSKPTADRLVPGFGEPVDLTPVPGFGIAVAEVKKDSSTASAKSKSDAGKSSAGDTADDYYDGPLLGKSSSSSNSGRTSTASNSRGTSSNTKVARYLSPAERLPEGLPAWFIRADLDGDGQVSMAEFASQWTEAEVARFKKYDLNGDGVITPEECLQVEKSAKK